MTRRVVGDRAISGSAASASQMGRFETKWLSRPENLAALADLPGQWIGNVHPRRPPKTIVLDMDPSESPTYGEQEGSAYKGHFGCTCYHPLFVFNQFGDVERCALRPGSLRLLRDHLHVTLRPPGATLQPHDSSAERSWAAPGQRWPKPCNFPLALDNRFRLQTAADTREMHEDGHSIGARTSGGNA
jgi:Transposase DDE domain group 1